LEISAFAKINLSLDVIDKRSDGYHNVSMIIQSIDLHDTILIEKINKGIELTSTLSWLPCNNQNIAYKAAEAMIEKAKIQNGFKINLKKRIPVSAGLAGGSTDAAAVLQGINKLMDLGLTTEDLCTVGKNLGADVPFCVKGGTCLAEGIGEKLSPISNQKMIYIVLIKPPFSVSTAWVYSNLDCNKISSHPDNNSLILALHDGNFDFLSKNMINVLESVTIEKYPIIQIIKNDLLAVGAKGSLMSGSGPSVFGIFDNKIDAAKAFDKLKNKYESIFLTHTCDMEEKHVQKIN
jgi:4-diphosphocytidyl-2-C-methyl-D-erythritol kinase